MVQPSYSYCTAPRCEDESRAGRRFCDFHEKRWQRCRCSGPCDCLTAPKVERLSPKERLLEAAYAIADAEGDEDFERSKRDLLQAARRLNPAALGDLVRHGMAQARARGVWIARPPKVTTEQAREAVRREGSIAGAARALNTTRPAIYRALARVSEGPLSLHAA